MGSKNADDFKRHKGLLLRFLTHFSPLSFSKFATDTDELDRLIKVCLSDARRLLHESEKRFFEDQMKHSADGLMRSIDANGFGAEKDSKGWVFISKYKQCYQVLGK